jgi:hypothetical protein
VSDHESNDPVWQVTRLCCRSGMCIDCHKRGGPNGPERRKRIVHADKLTSAMADRMVMGWFEFGAMKSRMPEPQKFEV